MKISASVYSGKGLELEALIKELDAYRVDYFHIDCLDDIQVFDDIERIRRISNTPIDLHLICPRPDKYYPLIEKHQIENITIQYEAIENGMSWPKNINLKFGLAISSQTPVDVFDKYEKNFSFVLFMATTPGISGGKFDKQNFRKIREFRAKYPDKKIHVDGGINAELSFILRNMGVYTVVVGSYLFKGPFIGSAMLNLKSDEIKSHYLVSDFMLEQDEIPVIQEKELTFEKALLKIDAYKMGFTNIAGDNQCLLGIITNADIRKGLIHNLSDLNKINTSSLINRKPAYIYEDNTVSDALAYIKNLNFPVLFLPVINRQKQITGTIKFNNLIKGES